jgi:hypothetical protein
MIPLLSGDCEGSERINPAIKAHLIRGAFYVILLVAICTIAIPAYAMTITVSDPNDGDTRNFDPVFNDQPFAGCGLFESFDTVTPPALPPDGRRLTQSILMVYCGRLLIPETQSTGPLPAKCCVG